MCYPPGCLLSSCPSFVLLSIVCCHPVHCPPVHCPHVCLLFSSTLSSPLAVVLSIVHCPLLHYSLSSSPLSIVCCLPLYCLPLFCLSSSFPLFVVFLCIVCYLLQSDHNAMSLSCTRVSSHFRTIDQIQIVCCLPLHCLLPSSPLFMVLLTIACCPPFVLSVVLPLSCPLSSCCLVRCLVCCPPIVLSVVLPLSCLLSSHCLVRCLHI